MKVAVISMALLFTILLCTPEDAQATFEASGGYCIGGDINIGRMKRAAPLMAEKLVELARQKRMAEVAEA